MTKRGDDLGLGQTITRRDFINGSTAMLGAALTGCRAPDEGRPEPSVSDDPFEVGETWYGPGGVGDYASSHGNTPEVLRTAHAVRAGAFDNRLVGVRDTGESYDLVIVGGGLSGLSAAHHFKRLRPDGRALILDNHPIFGGEAKRNELIVDGHRIVAPQGSDDFGILPETGDPDDYFTSLGIPRELAYSEATGTAHGLNVPTDHFSYLHWNADELSVGYFFDDAPSAANPMFPDLPARTSHLLRERGRAGWMTRPWDDPTRDREAIRKWRNGSADAARGDRELGAWLDSITVKTYYEEILGLPPSVTAYVDPILASIIGLGCDAISAWWGWHFELPGFRRTERYRDLTFHCFPGGNTGFARFFVKNLNPDAIEGTGQLRDVLEGSVRSGALDRETNTVNIRTNANAVHVQQNADETASVLYLHEGELYGITTRNVVMASGGWINQHIIRDLPEAHRRAYDGFRHSSVLVANVGLTNWRFLDRIGAAACVYEGGFGFSCNIARPMIVGDEPTPFSPDHPAFMTFYVPYYYPGLPAKRQGEAGRLELLSTSFEAIETRLREQMVRLFGDAGFDPANDVAGIILNRWGHAYTNPVPGFMFGENGAAPIHETVREPIGRIAIGHSELRGHQNWTGAAAEGRRAVETLLEA